MKILVNEKISQHKYKTPEGYLICVDSVLARTGNQTYRKNELFADSEDDSEIEVGRSPEEVFSAETLASFENKPITIEHPDEDVNVENYKDYSVGFVRDVKKGKFEDQDVILGTLVITDKDAIEGIENGEHVELSCGYDCDIEDGADGYQQKHIRGNHVALCEAGRAGIAKIIDSVGDEGTVKYKGYTFKFHKGYNMWLNMKDYYEVFDERGNKVAMKKDLKSAKEYVDNGGFKDSVGDAKKYAVEFTYDGDSVSNYLGQVWVYANSDKEALKKTEQWAKNKYDDAWNFKIVPKAYSNSEVIDSIEDANHLPPKLKNEIKKYLGRISTFVPKSKKDWEAKDFIDDMARYFRIDGTPLKFTRESIKGWNRTGDGTLRKDYIFSVDGYDDRFLFSIYANDDYETTEVNAHFMDSVKDAEKFIKEYGGYELYNDRGHIVIKKNGKVIQTADNISEAEHDIDEMKETKDSTPDEEQTTMLEKDLEHFEDAKETVTADTIDVGDVIYEKGARYEVIDVRENDPQSDEIILILKNSMGRTSKRYCKGNDKFMVGDSIHDVNPRSGESKDDFIARFMRETKNEYPNEKQRLAVAYSYWENKRKDSMVKDMTKLDVIKENKANYEKVSRKLNGMSGLQKLVAQYLILPWLSGHNWLGGLSDTQGNKAYAKIVSMGYDYRDIEKEEQRQQDEIYRLKDSMVKDAKINDLGPAVREMEINLIKNFNNDWKKILEHYASLVAKYKNNVKELKAKFKTEYDNRRGVLFAIEQEEKLLNEFKRKLEIIRMNFVPQTARAEANAILNKYGIKTKDAQPKDSIYALTVQGEKSKKLVRAKDAREAIDKYTRMFPKHKVSSVKKTDKFNKIIGLIKR